MLKDAKHKDDGVCNCLIKQCQCWHATEYKVQGLRFMAPPTRGCLRWSIVRASQEKVGV